MKKGCKVLFVALFMLLLAVQAQASVSFDTVNDLFSQTNFSATPLGPEDTTVLTGVFDFVYLGSEAANTNALLKTANGSIVFLNYAYNSYGASSPLATANNLDISGLYLQDLSYDPPARYAITEWSNYVNIYEILNPITVNGYTLTTGMFIFGFNDPGGSDTDFDDLVFAGSKVPVPGAVWLLGSALVGMVGMRRKLSV